MPAPFVVATLLEAATFDLQLSGNDSAVAELEDNMMVEVLEADQVAALVAYMGEDWEPSDEWQARARMTLGTGRVDSALREIGCL